MDKSTNWLVGAPLPPDSKLYAGAEIRSDSIYAQVGAQLSEMESLLQKIFLNPNINHSLTVKELLSDDMFFKPQEDTPFSQPFYKQMQEIFDYVQENKELINGNLTCDEVCKENRNLFSSAKNFFLNPKLKSIYSALLTCVGEIRSHVDVWPCFNFLYFCAACINLILACAPEKQD